MEQEQPSVEQPPARGDKTPMVENLEDGSKRFTIRVIRPNVFGVKSLAEIKEQHQAHSQFVEQIKKDDPDRRVSYPSYKGDVYDYKKLMPEIGSPESIEMRTDRPQVVICNVRHLKHENNLVSPEEQAGFRGRAEHLVDDLKLTPHTKVIVMASPAANFEAGDEGVLKNSRTEGTAKPIADVLSEKGVQFATDIDGPMGSVTLAFKQSLDEFRISDNALANQADEQITANMKAQKEGQPLPYPNMPAVRSVVYASNAPDLQDLEAKTGITEVSSATIARGLQGFDRIKDYFFRDGNYPQGADKVVIIAARHGQFNTDISEALKAATDGAHPIIFADNGSYLFTNMAPNSKGEVVEEYVTQTGNRTGMILRG